MQVGNVRLQQQIQFIVEIDKLKSILRQSLLCDGSRRENDAEHSWHLAAMASLLQEYATESVDLVRVLKMLLIHDIVEIDAGDTYAYDPEANVTRAAREQVAADRLFGLLPADQRDDFRALWEEFETGVTAESRYANALDRLQPLLLNYYSEGKSWRAHGVTADAVIKRMQPIKTGAPQLWTVVEQIVSSACEMGYLAGAVPVAD
ncbi:MAG TPA: HD domain-containing protein [Terriglobales bacterium]|nr:HD domain-containing protein [Terriglobales bacterium]